ncbi:MAG TPA: hypothetical protein VGY56_03205 [Verrucomicrobiae bacterium]|nr:hypothetical protein [Verrucomicrobiae bacterium]
MNRVGRLFICIAGGVALSVAARGDVTPYANVNVNSLHGNTNLMNRNQLMKKHHLKNPPGFPQFQGPNTPQANVLPANIPQPFKSPTTDAHTAPAAAVAPSGNPYESIVTRNVFGLNPIPVVTIPDAPPGPPPPKITLTGIMTIFGPTEALFKVAGVVRNHGQPHDESYIFTEGEMQDDVEVTKIDTNKMMVTFMNHGVQQDIGLTEGVASTGPAPSTPTFPGQPGMRKFGRRFGAFGGAPGGYQPQSFNSYGGGGDNGSQNNNNPLGAFNNNSQSGNYHNNTYVSPTISQLSDEDQSALVAAAHAQAVQSGDPTAAIFPPTQFDQQAASELGGGNSQNPSGSPSPGSTPQQNYYPRR